MADVTIYVITHKKYDLLDEGIYKPLFVGAEGKEETFGYLRDDEGENISSKNNLYSESTGLYWIWKNSAADIAGINHYKRYFKTGFLGSGDCLDKDTIIKDLKTHDIILNKRKNGVTNWRLFQFFMSEENLKKSCNVVKKHFPDYYKDYIKLLNSRYLYPYCLFVAKKEFTDDYSSWLFEFLEILEKELEITDRILGYFSELALSLYVVHNRLSVKTYCLDFRNQDIGFYKDIDFPLWKTQKKYSISLSLFTNFYSKSNIISYIMVKVFEWHMS